MFVVACGQPAQEAKRETSAPPVEQAAPQPAPKQETPDNRKVLLVVGDSISAGYGLQPGQSYPDVMQRTLDAENLPWHVVNQGVSGDTTSGGAARITAGLNAMPKVVLLELGGNDGLRGMPLAATRANLEKMITVYQKAGAQVVLAGMTLPPNYGPDYIKGFEQIYKDLAAKYKVKLIPFLLADMITKDLRYFQPDGIHPTENGAEIVADTALKTLRPLLK
jgi:acyl-CoA thioesterase-1